MALAISNLYLCQNGANIQNFEFLFHLFPFLMNFAVWILQTDLTEHLWFLWEIKGYRRTQRGPTSKMIKKKKKNLSQICLLFFFPLNSFEIFLSGIWQHLFCSSYRFQDTNWPERPTIIFFLQVINWFQLFSSGNCFPKVAGYGQKRPFWKGV